MRTLFIADLHLNESRPDLTALFLQFLQTQAKNADALYILGDLFESYIGDDEKTPLQKQVSQALYHLKERGIPVYLMQGNRDFLMGKAFAKRCGATLLKDPTIIHLYGTPTLLMHGDTLCTQDTDYLAFRKKARHFFYQTLFLLQSLKKRREIFTKARQISQMHNRNTALAILDATPSAIPEVMLQYGVRQLIHGHTHRPSLHYFWQTGERYLRIVLSDWENHGHFLVYEQNGVCRLEIKKFSNLC